MIATEHHEPDDSCRLDINWDTPVPGWVPAQISLQDWVRRTIECVEPELLKNGVDVSLQFSDSQAMSRLNGTYRHKPVPTNVLSFANRCELEQGRVLIGDIVICPEVVETQARAQNKTPLAHLTHLVIHGTLHLLGHDHENAADAQRMEGLEINLLRALGQADPYTMVEPIR